MTMMEAEHRRTPGHAAEEPHRSGETAGATEKDPDAVGTIVVKIGGSTLGSHDTTLEDLVALQSQGIQPIVVHGGGKTISEWMERQGVRPRFVRGLRVTDEPSLDIVVGVLSGVVNKAIVASILALNGRAVGLSGVDGGMLRAKVMEPELGLVGSVVEVDPRPARAVIEAGFMPVIAPVAVRSSEAGTHGGSLLNVNADTAAGEIALALGAERLVFLTDVAGVMDSSRRVMPRLTQRQAAGLMGSGVVAGGMVPKIGACLRALDEVGSTHIIDGREPHALREVLSGADLGTRVG
jgi:acetylglutamate kinase